MSKCCFLVGTQTSQIVRGYMKLKENVHLYTSLLLVTNLHQTVM